MFVQLNDMLTNVPLYFTMKNLSLFKRSMFAATLISLILTSVGAFFAQSPLAKPREERLLNGLKVLMFSDSAAKDVTVRVRIHSGAAFDPQGKEGVMRLLADNIFPNDAAREYFREDLGGGLEIVTNYDYIQVTASAKPEDFLTMLDTLASAVANPAIDKPTTAKLKASLIAQVKLLEADPAYTADQAAAKRLFGTFPYGRPQYGSSDSIEKVDFADLIDAKQRFLTADNATIAVSGNFDKVLGFRAIRRYFGAWLKSDKRVPSTFRQPDPPPTGLLMLNSPKPDESAMRFAVRGTNRKDKDFAASTIYASVLETRLRARVPAAFAEKVSVRSESHTLPGVILIGFSASKNDIGTGNGKVEGNELVAKAIADPITEAEFQTAKTAFAAEWAKVDVATLWLDLDTFKTTDTASDSKVAEAATLADVRAFADRIKNSPMAAVLVNTPAN